MLSAKLWYTRKPATWPTGCPFWYSVVGRLVVPAGPVPLMPKRLWSWLARLLPPQPDSSMACAMVTAAGTPYRLWAATAPGAIDAINACCAAVASAGGSGTGIVVGLCRWY